MVLDDWIEALQTELGLDVDVDVRALLDVARVAAHAVDRPAAPLTTFLIGYAAARADAPDVGELCRRAATLAEAWRPGTG
ncbi:hypothetical protein LX15_004239 [Streptoalloteichus tenebrarius]|uniref:DUF6457 domain-containing protein n=1 Tax=Streptoalloteichus tenebrarius (strain ATCC 17920 / DSM 40477 / JCM 4838 / CBS 697.72 / NBRC 16177 / NCIMB 11028 / NRRL B-12390 / A12253. 1 / ISP 5477) TaxID=1933 RepID=A0ABT1HYE7_STRSD|nr:DUF6457 domain-containing protein [Streptoalloteichus tenebrarius]MCP2260521.1 hypothetical protein [Streptoalloteichus tenebrarius]BFF01861.1 hypothetical protein GCM10020241_35360 [Streptoalloteichus tenebrarius]